MISLSIMAILAVTLIVILAANSVDYATGLTYDTDRGPSPSVWKDARIRDYRENPAEGFIVGSDFVQTPTTPSTASGSFLGGFGDFAIFLSQGATIARSTAGGSEIVMSSDGDDEAAVLASTTGAALIAAKTGSGLRRAWFETRVKVSTISDTKNDFFAGICEGITPSAVLPITATAGTMADKNLLGFQRLATDGDQIDVVYKADGQTVQYPLTDIITVANSGTLGLVADTYVKLGFVYDMDKPAAERITFYVNGMKQSTFITEAMIQAATFPNDAYMSLALAVVNATASSPGTNTVDWAWLAGEYKN